MKLIEVLIAILVFSIFSLGVMTQLNAEAKLYMNRVERLNELEARIFTLR